ncbi:RNA-binding protein [Trypanosoma theileri]|uniref:RNA-binding protein n=1 Tax=Trypanosoma theileri TaxID=67003 RepID=A0A1X0P1B5_9TRYP|nr:RNA-binding protein [Trypanosoma theileri]ORC90200.1 RNA-binding protein [Trypanosoma theileri]
MPVFKDPNQRVHMILQQLGYEPTPMYGSNKDEKEDGSYTMTAETTTTPITTAALTGITGTVEDENIVDPTLSLEPYFDDDDDDDDDDCDNLFFGSSTFHSCNDEGSGVDRNGLTLTASTVDLNRRSGVTPGPDPHNDTQSSTNLFISNFPHNYGENELEAMFAPYGEILSAAVMRNIHTGKSRGTAFVRYATTEQAKRAIAEVNGQNVRGRTISVHWAKKQHDDTPVGEARKKIFKLFVRNIPLDVTLEQLKELFRQYGPVKEISIHKDTAPNTAKSDERRIAFVTYLAEGAAERAAECVHNTRPFPSSGSIPLMVKLAEDTPEHCRRHNQHYYNNYNINDGNGNGIMSSGSSSNGTCAGRPILFVNGLPETGVRPVGGDGPITTSPLPAIPVLVPAPLLMPTTTMPFCNPMVAGRIVYMPPVIPGIGVGGPPSYILEQPLDCCGAVGGVPMMGAKTAGVKFGVQTAGNPAVMLTDTVAPSYSSAGAAPMQRSEFTGMPLYMSSTQKPATVNGSAAIYGVGTEDPQLPPWSCLAPNSSSTATVPHYSCLVKAPAVRKVLNPPNPIAVEFIPSHNADENDNVGGKTMELLGKEKAKGKHNKTRNHVGPVSIPAVAAAAGGDRNTATQM